MSRSRRLAAALSAAVLLGVGLVAALPATAATKALVADQTTALQDGAGVTITGSGLTPGQPYLVYQCRKGDYPVGQVVTSPVAYAGHQMSRYYADCNPDEADPKIDNSGRAAFGLVDPTGHLTVTTHVVEGTLAEDRPDTSYVQVPVSFTCDDTSPCTLLVITADSYKTVQSFPITFAPSASTACAAPTDTTPSGTGPYSMTTTYQRWATASCATGTAAPLLADYTDTGEAAGLSAFAAGQSDYALSAAGFTSPGGSDIDNARPAVLTPVAAEAAVIAFDGGSVLTDVNLGRDAAVPVTDLSLTTDEVAGLFSSPFGTSAQKSPALVARNPQLQQMKAKFGPQATLVVPDGVIATPDATVLAMTTAWAAAAKTPWTHGVLRAFPSSLGTGADDTSSIPLLSTLPALRTRVLGSVYSAHATPARQVFLYLTDSATAAQLGLHVAKLQNATGAFVAPTPESIAAGIKGMKAGADGVLAPDPANADPAAYPLPLVQYAVTPHETFAAQKPLLQFLTYATTTGQRAQDLAPGIFPLPADLQAQATASLPLIGSTSPPSTATPTTPSGGSTPLGGSGALPTGSLPHTTLPRSSTSSLPAGTPPAAGPTATPSSAPTPAPVALPAFTVSRDTPMHGLLAPLGVAALAALLFSAAYGSSGRPLPPTLAAGSAALRRTGTRLTRRRRPGA